MKKMLALFEFESRILSRKRTLGTYRCHEMFVHRCYRVFCCAFGLFILVLYELDPRIYIVTGVYMISGLSLA